MSEKIRVKDCKNGDLIVWCGITFKIKITSVIMLLPSSGNGNFCWKETGYRFGFNCQMWVEKAQTFKPIGKTIIKEAFLFTER